MLPGTEIAFDEDVVSAGITPGFYPAVYKTLPTKVGRFRQVKKDQQYTHHDALELSTGDVVMLNWLRVDQKATVLQLPAAPKTVEEAKEQARLEFVE